MNKRGLLKFILISMFLLVGFGLMAQAPPPPPGDHGQGGNQPIGGGGAPIAGGLGIMLALGAVYGGHKVYKAWKKLDKLEE